MQLHACCVLHVLYVLQYFIYYILHITSTVFQLIFSTNPNRNETLCIRLWLVSRTGHFFFFNVNTCRYTPCDVRGYFLLVFKNWIKTFCSSLYIRRYTWWQVYISSENAFCWRLGVLKCLFTPQLASIVGKWIIDEFWKTMNIRTWNKNFSYRFFLIVFVFLPMHTNWLV